MTTAEAEQLRRDIEQTQRGLSHDVNALAEKVTPRRIVQRRMTRARRAITTMKDRIMGTAADSTSVAADRMSSATSTVSDTASSAADSVSSATSAAAQTIAEAPRAVRRQTEGNPLAAGLIAFGLGWLTGSLLPPSRREQELAEQAKDMAREHGQPIVGQVADQMKENLREPAQQAVESVRSTAADAQSTVADEARAAADDVTTRAQDAKDRVADQTGQRS